MRRPLVQTRALLTAGLLLLSASRGEAQAADPQAVRRTSKNAVGAFILEYAIPGAGHIYVRDTWGAVNVLGMVAAGTMMSMKGNSTSVVGAGVAVVLLGRVWGLVDAPRAAKRYNRRHSPPRVHPSS